MNNAKMPTLKQKLEEKAQLVKELDKVEDKIDEISGDKKEKIKKVVIKKK